MLAFRLLVPDTSVTVFIREELVSEVVGNEPYCQCDNKIDHDENETLEVVGSVVGDGKVDNEDCEEEQDGGEWIKKQREGLASHPCDEDQQRNDEERNLDGGTNGNRAGHLDLVLPCKDDGSQMLGCVTCDGKQDKTNPSTCDSAGGGDNIDGINEPFGSDTDEGGNNNEGDDDGRHVHLWCLFLVFFIVIIKELFVRRKTEVKESGVDEQKKHRYTTAELENVGTLCLVGNATENCVESRGNDKRNDGHHEERSVELSRC